MQTFAQVYRQHAGACGSSLSPSEVERPQFEFVSFANDLSAASGVMVHLKLFGSVHLRKLGPGSYESLSFLFQVFIAFITRKT